jgi:hypothetical protein
LNQQGIVLHDVQVARREGGSLVTLYDHVAGSFQDGALDDLLAEVRKKTQDITRHAATPSVSS